MALTVTDPLAVAFIQGAKWWEYETTGATMWKSDQKKAAEEALARMKNGTLGVIPDLDHFTYTREI